MDTINRWLNQEGKSKKTSIFIAHRLSTIADCDLIHVLDHGVVIESGTHNELLKVGGMYARMWKAQSRSS